MAQDLPLKESLKTGKFSSNYINILVHRVGWGKTEGGQEGESAKIPWYDIYSEYSGARNKRYKCPFRAIVLQAIKRMLGK